MCRPVRIALMNMSSVQIPMPVFLSGVRFIVYEMPHGPAHAVFVTPATMFHGALTGGGAGICSVSGWPESIRDMSGSGPFGPIFQGVWQSLHPPIVTRYWPRAIVAAFAACGPCAFASLQAAVPSAALRTAAPVTKIGRAHV